MNDFHITECLYISSNVIGFIKSIRNLRLLDPKKTDFYELLTREVYDRGLDHCIRVAKSNYRNLLWVQFPNHYTDQNLCIDFTQISEINISYIERELTVRLNREVER
jgi:hypothetical protein